MNSVRFAALLIVVVAIAVTAGWLFDPRSETTGEPALQAPDNIDYYMTGVDYRAFDDQGRLQYRLHTPYLEHFIREDASHLQTPRIDYYAEDGRVQLESTSGVLNHPQDILDLRREVRLSRRHGAVPFELTSDALILHSADERIEIPAPLTLLQRGLTLHAADATLDMKTGQHRFSRVRATYEDMGKPDAVELLVHEGGHEVDLPGLRSFLKRWLRDPDGEGREETEERS